MPMILGGSGTISSDKITSDANGNFGVGTSPISKVTLLTTPSNGNVLDWGTGQVVFTSTTNANTRSLGLGVSVDANGSYLSSLIPTVDWSPLHLRAKSHTMYAEGSTESLKISATGIVTKPSQPAFSVYKNDGDLVTAAASPIKFLAVNYDTKSNYSTSTGRFTAPITGKYLFTFSGITHNISNYFYVWFALNGSTLSYTTTHRPATEGEYSFMAMSHVIHCAAGDYVTTVVGYNGGSPYFEAARSSFSGFLLG